MGTFRDAFKDVPKHSAKDAKRIVQTDPRYKKSMDKKKNKKEARDNRKNNG